MTGLAVLGQQGHGVMKGKPALCAGSTGNPFCGFVGYTMSGSGVWVLGCIGSQWQDGHFVIANA